MKKLLSIAIAAAVAAPMAVSADTTMYGRIDNALTYTDDGTNEAFDVQEGDGISRFGVKGSEDLGNGLKAIFQYEWATSTAEGGSWYRGEKESTPGYFVTGFTNRLGYVGLTGNFGTVAIGRQWTPYFFAVGKTAIMNAPNESFRASLNTYRTGNAVSYTTPNMSGFVGQVALVMDNNANIVGAGGDTEEGVDVAYLSLKYDNGPLSAGFGYRHHASVAATDDIDVLGVSAAYNFGSFKLIGAYEDADTGDTNKDVDAWSVAGEAYFGNNTIKGQYSNKDYDGTDVGSYDQFALGVQHNFSKRTRVYAEYANVDYDEAGKEELDQFSIGLRHDF